MYTLSDEQFQQKIEPILRKVFVNNDPFDTPFSPNIISKMILYPCEIDLDHSLLNAIIKAASREGDSGCYLSQLWQFGDNYYYHCYIPLPELINFYTQPLEGERSIKAQLRIQMNPEYVLFSEHGTWGLMVSHEYHGLLGGSIKFMKTICEELTSLGEQVYNWLNLLRWFQKQSSNTTLDWLPGLLAHVYDEGVAQRIIEKTEIQL